MVEPKIKKLYDQLVSGERSGDLFLDEVLAGEYDHNASLVFGEDLEKYQKNIDFLLDLTTYRPTDMVVDLGCGTGISILRLLQRNPGRIIGLDFSEPMLRQAREKLKERDNVEFHIASAEDIGAVVHGADKVVSANVFQYISDPDTVLREIHKALNPDGEYVFNVRMKARKEQSVYFRAFRAIEAAIEEHVGDKVELPELKGLQSQYERRDLEELAARNGFTVVRYEERPVILEQKHLRAIHQQALEGMEPDFVSTVGEEIAGRIIGSVKAELSNMYSAEGFVAGKEAYVCLGKTLTDREGT